MVELRLTEVTALKIVGASKIVLHNQDPLERNIKMAEMSAGAVTQIQSLAAAAKEKCPISRLLAAAEIKLEASLA